MDVPAHSGDSDFVSRPSALSCCSILSDITVLLFLMSTGVFCWHLIQRMNVVSVLEVGEGGQLFTEPTVSAEDHTAMQHGTRGPQIIRYKRSVRCLVLPAHPTSSQPNYVLPADRLMKQL